jgi:aminopeptidase N
VEADFLDGMEYDGLYFLSKGFYNLYDGSPQGYLTMIAVHETAHQWWYTKVANDQALEPWLDEALCTYSELIFYENLYPELADWWWEYRVNYYQPSGKIDLTIYDYAGFTPYRDAAYLQGAKFLHQLRAQLGDEQFFTFLHTYASMYNGKISSTAFFWQLAGRIAKNDLTDLMDEFFQKSYQMGPLN